MLEFIPNISTASHVICMITYVATAASRDLVYMTYVTSHDVCNVTLQLNSRESVPNYCSLKRLKYYEWSIFREVMMSKKNRYVSFSCNVYV